MRRRFCAARPEFNAPKRSSPMTGTGRWTAVKAPIHCAVSPVAFSTAMAWFVSRAISAPVIRVDPLELGFDDTAHLVGVFVGEDSQTVGEGMGSGLSQFHGD